MNLAFDLVVNNTDPEEDRFWQAVVDRDPRMDGQFVFAVSSTRIYCRPSCPSRRPHRERVSFFSLPEAAERAGFRACKRCQPRRAHVIDPQVEMVQKVCSHLEANQANDLTLSELAKEAGVSAFHLQRTFKNVMGVSPREYAAAQKFESFKSKLRDGETVTNALYDAGLNSSRRLYEHAPAELGMTPATYGRGGQGATISYTTTQSVFGRLLVAMTERGICAVKLADNDEEMERDLREEFPAARIERADAPLQETVEEILGQLANRSPHVNLPLDIRATAFQRQVWEKLRLIPYGQTVSYGDVAKALGNRGAVRAVGRACATNPVALVIPCHRVVREDKSLGGYRWGLDRKKRLLEYERASKKRE